MLIYHNMEINQTAMKDPAFLFYPGDWLGGTMGMTFEQKGCYIELLMMQFNLGQFTEAQAKQVLSICFDLAWATLKHKFDTDGVYFWNNRLRLEIEKRRRFSESRRSNAFKKKPIEHMVEHMVEHMEDENDNTNTVISSREKSVREEGEISVEIMTVLTFSEFWDLYDKKVGLKEKVEKKFKATTEKDREKMIGHISDYKLSQPDKQYRKDPMTYLNNKAWNDEIIFKNGNQQSAGKQGATADEALRAALSGVYSAGQYE